ncbi:hypothetical protein P9112_004569 [Eukaryota sp. TZLM1-RC]
MLLLIVTLLLSFSTPLPLSDLHWCADVVTDTSAAVAVNTILTSESYYLRVRVCLNHQFSPDSSSQIISVGNTPVLSILSGHTGVNVTSPHPLPPTSSTNMDTLYYPFTTLLPQSVMIYISSPPFAVTSLPQPAYLRFSISSIHFKDGGVVRTRVPLRSDFTLSEFNNFPHCVNSILSTISLFPFSVSSSDPFLGASTDGDLLNLQVFDFADFFDESINSCLSFGNFLFIGTENGVLAFDLIDFDYRELTAQKPLSFSTNFKQDYISSSESRPVLLILTDDFELIEVDLTANLSSFSLNYHSSFNSFISLNFDVTPLNVLSVFSFEIELNIVNYLFGFENGNAAIVAINFDSNDYVIKHVFDSPQSITSAVTYQSDLICFGSGALYSLDFGLNFHELIFVEEEAFVSLTIGRDFGVIGVTSRGSIFKGSLPNFDTFGRLFELNGVDTVDYAYGRLSETYDLSLSIFGDGQLSHHHFPKEELVSFAENCADQSFISTSYDNDPSILIGDPSSSDYWLPNEVYLGHGKCFSFHMTSSIVGLVGQPVRNPFDIFVLNSNYLSIDLSQFTDFLLGVVGSKVTVCDNAEKRSVEGPGENLALSPVRVTVKDHCFLCNRAQEDLIPSKTIDVYTGCRPHQSIKYDHSQISTRFTCPEGQICAHYELPFISSFYHIDEITGLEISFPGEVSISVIGGGPSTDSVELWNEEQIRLYNLPSSSSVYYIANITKDYDPESDISFIPALFFMCSSGSPCSGLFPKNLFGHAEFVFRIEAYSTNSNFGEFCRLSTTFDLILIGIPLGLMNSILVTLGLATLLVVIVYFIHLKQQYNRKKLLKDIDNGIEFDSIESNSLQ